MSITDVSLLLTLLFKKRNTVLNPTSQYNKIVKQLKEFFDRKKCKKTQQKNQEFSKLNAVNEIRDYSWSDVWRFQYMSLYGFCCFLQVFVSFPFSYGIVVLTLFEM